MTIRQLPLICEVGRQEWAMPPGTTPEKMKGVVVLHSGGIDSSVLLYHYVLTLKCDVLSLGFNYGQKHQLELYAASHVVGSLKERTSGVKIERLVLNIPPGTFGHTSALIQGGPNVPEGTYDEMEMGPLSTEVPFRNGVFISLATSVAMQRGYDTVGLGVHMGDSRRWNYPDCSPDFIEAMRRAVETASNWRVTLDAPFLFASKAGLVTQGHLLDVPFEQTLSCYRAPDHCGTCPTCHERKKAFRDAGVDDPTYYKE